MLHSLSFGILQKSMTVFKAPVELHDKKNKMLHVTKKMNAFCAFYAFTTFYVSLNSLCHVITDYLQQELQYCSYTLLYYYMELSNSWDVGHPRTKFWGVQTPTTSTISAPMQRFDRSSQLHFDSLNSIGG